MEMLCQFVSRAVHFRSLKAIRFPYRCVSSHQGQKDMGEVGRANAGGQVVSRNH